MLELVHAVYRPTQPWANFVHSAGRDAVIGELGALLSGQLETAMNGMDPAHIKRNFVVSTMLDLPVTSGWLDWDLLQPATQRPGVPRFDNFVLAYECASWGYCLRYAKRFLKPGECVAISVLDLNIFDLTYWDANPNWGQSGFGLATVILRMSDQDTFDCRTAKSANGFGEFCLDLRRIAKEDAVSTLVPPYFPAEIAAMYTNLVPEDRRTENFAETWGHCFGSDPWVGLIIEAKAGRATPDRQFIATSVALNGYWALATLTLNPNGHFAILPDLSEPSAVREAA